jgi:hypothetical protein
MQKTANQIKSEFELLASGHYQIHSFLYAQEFEQQAYENLIYPLMLVYPLGGSLSGTSYTRNYRVVIADRVLKSEGNELEVESDTQLIALDTLAYWMKLGTNERFSITSSNTITPFWEKWGDEVTGHFVDIGIEEFYDFNSCAIPLSSAIPSPSNPCKDARILINSVVYGNAPSDTNFNVVVKDQLGALVGSLIGGEWIVNTGGSCADATYTIEDSLGNVLYTGTIPSGGSVTEVIGNSTLNVNKSDGTLISSRSILAEGTDSYNVGNSSAVLKDEDGNVLSTTPIKATETEDIVAPNGDVSVNSVAFDDVLSGGTLNIQVRKSTGNDLIGSKQGQYWRIGDSTAVIKDSANNTLKSEAIMATETENITINDSVAVIKNSAGTTLKSENILAEATENISISDSVAVIKNSAGTTLKSENILAQASENITINDSTAVIKDSIGTTLKTEPILAEASENITINDSSVNVNKSNGTLISAVSVKAENTASYNVVDSTITNSDSTYDVDVKATESLSLPDSQINVNSVDSGDVVSVKTIDVNLEDSLGAPVVPTSVGLVGNTLTIEVPSSAPPSTGDYLVRFFDIDGTILKEEYVDAGNSATAPSTPTYDSTYLTFKEWNKTFSVINQDTDVGAIYDTIDGKTYLFLRITNVSGLQPTLQLNKSTTNLMTINWGDATTNTTSTSGNVNITKTAAYSAIGDYVVTIEDSGAYGVNTGGYILGNNVTYSSCLLIAYLGVNFTTISASSFRANTALRVISLNDNITTINLFTFTDTNGLLSINLPNSITTFNSGFSTGLKTITIPLSITSLPSSVFSGCSSLVNAIIPSSINTLGNTAFANCFSLRKIDLSNITNLSGAGIFATASSLESVILNNSVTSIQSTLFQNCTVLNSVNIPTSVTSVAAQAFLNCNNLKELEFPSTLTSIATQAFQGCNSILEYTFLSTTPPTLASTSAFASIKSTCKIYVPDANVAAYQAATNWSTYANYIYPLSTKP